MNYVSAKLRRVKDEELPLKICLDWELENVQNHRLVLQENETGEIDVRNYTVKPVLSEHSKIDKMKVFKIGGSLIQV